MSKCTDQESLYEDIDFCQGQSAPAGIRDYFYAISKRDIVSWPTISRTGKTTLDAIPVYDGDFKLAADKKFVRIALIPDQSQIQSESQGSYGGKSFKNTATLVVPTTREAITGFISEANNDDMVFLVPDRNGKFRMVGSEVFMPELTLAQDSGKAATDTNSTTVTAVSTDIYPAPFYPGKIETNAGDISGADGKPLPADPANPDTGGGQAGA